MWNRSSPISSTAILCKIRQVTFLLSSPDLMSPLICKFWAGGLLSRLSLWLLEAADSSGYLPFQKKEEKSCFPPFTTFSPFQRLSGVTGQCFNTGKCDCVWGEPVWICVRLHSTCPPSTMHFASFFFFSLGKFSCSCFALYNQHALFIFQHVPSTCCGQEQLQKSRATWQLPETFTYLWSCLC